MIAASQTGLLLLVLGSVVLLLAIGIWACNSLSGMYGICVAAVGLAMVNRRRRFRFAGPAQVVAEAVAAQVDDTGTPGRTSAGLPES